MKGWRKNGAFTLIELLVVIAIIALLIGILLPALGQAKKQGRITQCFGRMQQMGVAANAYSVTYQDKIVSFSWTTNLRSNTQFADLQGPFADDIAASAAQAIDIIRRRVGLTQSDITLPTAWIPQIIYNHLAMVEDQDWKISTQNVICPDDGERLRWSKSWPDFVAGAFAPTPSTPSGPVADQNRRWFASASYVFTTAAMAPDSGQAAIQNAAGTHRMYLGVLPADADKYGKRKAVSVQSPSSKVMMHDTEARHYGKRSWNCIYPEAQQPMLFFDGHVKVYTNGVPFSTGLVQNGQTQRQGNKVNPGWVPRAVSQFPMNITYIDPEPFESPLRNGSYTGSDTNLPGYMKYTRGGLKGIDVDGAEPYFAN